MIKEIPEYLEAELQTAKDEYKVKTTTYVTLTRFDYEKLIQENQQLKEKYNVRTKAYDRVLLQKINLKDGLNEIKEYIEDKIYSIEPKGTRINYNCEYDSEEDFINAMEERSKLNTLKEVLQILDKVKE